jgi:3-hydroxyisobutyrate dehydrogenase-like beta-hydroxyacid dehydrogenase
VSGAQFVITKLPTADIVLVVVEPLFAEWPDETIWLQMSSVGAGEADRLAEVASAHGVTGFDGPVANHWMIAMVAALAEAMHLCRLVGLEEQEFVTLLDGGRLAAPTVSRSSGRCSATSSRPAFPVRLALKDLKLVREVAKDSGVELPVLDAVLERIGDVENSHVDDDLAAVYELNLPSVGGG